MYQKLQKGYSVTCETHVGVEFPSVEISYELYNKYTALVSNHEEISTKMVSDFMSEEIEPNALYLSWEQNKKRGRHCYSSLYILRKTTPANHAQAD